MKKQVFLHTNGQTTASRSLPASPFTRLWILPLAAITAGAFLTTPGCVSNAVIQKHEQAMAELPPPVLVEPPIHTNVRKFGNLVRAVVNSTGERDIVLSVDPIINISGVVDKVPHDVSPWVRQVIDDVGKPLRTAESVPTRLLVRTPFSASIGPVQSDHEIPITPTYRVIGSLQQVFKRYVKGRQTEIAVQAGKGGGSSDGQAKRNNRLTITSLTLSLTIEEPNGLAIPGATASYKIDYKEDEFDGSISFYVGGTGIGGGSAITITQDLGLAIYSAAAAAVEHVLGHVLLVPYYQCSPLFRPDERLDARMRDILNRFTRAQVEETLKRYLYLSGQQMDMAGPALTPEDRTKMIAAMQAVSLDFNDRSALVEFTFRHWKNIDMNRAAVIADKRVGEIVHGINEKNAAQAASKAKVDVGPAEFGWPDSTQMALLDLTRVKDAAVREQILAAARTCAGCDQVVAAATNAVLGIRLSSDPFNVQQALRRARFNVDYVWVAGKVPRLCVVPK